MLSVSLYPVYYISSVQFQTPNKVRLFPVSGPQYNGVSTLPQPGKHNGLFGLKEGIFTNSLTPADSEGNSDVQLFAGNSKDMRVPRSQKIWIFRIEDLEEAWTIYFNFSWDLRDLGSCRTNIVVGSQESWVSNRKDKRYSLACRPPHVTTNIHHPHFKIQHPASRG